MTYTNDDELYHYGVLGMKWGVKRGNVSQAYERASRKLNRLNSNVEKSAARARRASERADNKMYSLFSSQYSRTKAVAKARRASYKLAKQTRKAAKWYKAMEKTFANTGVSMTKEQAALGKSYMDRLTNRAERY